MERAGTSFSAIVAISILAILHMVGLAGFALPEWQGLFKALVPIHLLISALLLLGFHQHWSIFFLINSLGLAAGGWLVEFLGVHTQVLFGAYHYTSVLGPGIGGVPLIMALNWLMLIYGVGSVVQRLPLDRLWQVLLGGLIMVLLDFALEHFAMTHNLWIWEGGYVPLQNYAMWFVISCLLLGRFLTVARMADNPVAAPLIGLQGLFFYGSWLVNWL